MAERPNPATAGSASAGSAGAGSGAGAGAASEAIDADFAAITKVSPTTFLSSHQVLGEPVLPRAPRRL